jgi:N-acyl-L-homoserine lactone synthetase
MYTFEHVLYPSGKENAFRLRYEVYCKEKGWLDPTQYTDMLERDEHDEKSETFLAYDDNTNQVIGTARLIISDTDFSSLHIEKHPSINGNINTVKCVEISRMAILESARQGNVFIGLIRMLFRHILKHHSNFEYIYFTVEERFLHKVNQLGFEFIPFAPSALWYCDQLVPARQIIVDMDDCLKRNNPEFHRWLWGDTETMSSNETFIYFLSAGRKISRSIQEKNAFFPALQANSFLST